MYIHVYIYVNTCIYMYIHVYTCTCNFKPTRMRSEQNRTEVLGPPPEPEFCALSFWNDRGSPLAPSDSVLFEKLMIF